MHVIGLRAGVVVEALEAERVLLCCRREALLEVAQDPLAVKAAVRVVVVTVASSDDAGRVLEAGDRPVGVLGVGAERRARVGGLPYAIAL